MIKPPRAATRIRIRAALPPPPPGADPLAARAQERIRATCKHPNLRFEQNGALIRCVECSRPWHAWSDSIKMPDYLYVNPALNESETRNSPFSVPRIK